MTTLTALDIWQASQTGMVQTFARKLWGTRDGAEDGIQSAIVYALTRKDWFDAAKGRVATWLMLILKSVRQAERSKGHRRGTVSEPRVCCPGEEAIPDLLDLCDPEGILIAREISLADLEAKHADSRRKLSSEAVAFIRASPDTPGIQLARRYGVTPQTVYNIRNGRSHKGT